MNKTKFIIAVTGRLAAAPDSDAKEELIEELSENLYGRYTDLVSAGVPENEAFDRAMGELGDVNELLAYLDGAAPGGEWSRERSRDFSASVDGFLSGVDGFVRKAVDQARDAMDDAAAMVKDAAQGVHIHMGDFSGFSDEADFRVDVDRDGSFSYVDGESVSWKDGEASEGLRMVDVALQDGDVRICFDEDPSAPVRLEGGTEGLQVQRRDGVLHIRQGRTAGEKFFFVRMLRSTNFDLILPRRQWEEFRISTASGDVELDAGAACDRLNISTASGDVELGSGLRCGLVDVKTASGDMELREADCGRVRFATASGDFCADGLRAEALQAESISGDIQVFGSLGAVRCSSTSGDVEVRTDILPGQLELTSKSGECEAALPDDGTGFTLQFRTVSGELYSDFPLSGPMGKRSGTATYLGGGERTFHMSSISGDVSLHRQP